MTTNFSIPRDYKMYGRQAESATWGEGRAAFIGEELEAKQCSYGETTG